MTIEEMISAVERLQTVHDLMSDEQHEAQRYIRGAIKHLADKIYMASL